MSTSLQLVPAYFDSKPEQWRRDYVKNMRQIRGYPTYWRIRDDFENVDGPPAEGERYTRELFIWEARVLKDSEGNNTNKVALYNLIESTNTEQLPSGDSVYKPQEPEPVFVHEHTEVVDSVSIEFDQNGRRMVSFESAGDVYLIWYDPQAQTTVTTNFGAGYTPQVVTDTYRRTGGSADSTRYLFYVDGVTKQIVYRAQLDRFGVVYTLPDAPGDVVELLKVSKNLYGGLTALYVYEESPEVLSTGSFTAKIEGNKVDPGTDDFQKSRITLAAVHSAVGDFYLGPGGELRASATMSQSDAYVDSFVLRSAQFFLNEQSSNAAPLVQSASSVADFLLKSVQTYVEASESSEASPTLLQTSANVDTYVLKVSKIHLGGLDASEALPLQRTSSSVTQFTLG